MNEEITSNINTNVSSTRSNLNVDISNVSKVQNDSENYLLKMEIEKLTNEIKLLKSQPFSFCVIENTNSLITYYTGMPNKSVIDLLFGIFKSLQINYFLGWNVERINRNDQILMTLMKLRLNIDFIDLGSSAVEAIRYTRVSVRSSRN